MKILLLDNWGEKVRDLLRDMVTSGVCQPKEIDGIIFPLKDSGHFPINSFSNLKFIASCTTGLDHLQRQVDYCKAKGIKIISLQGERDFLNSVWATAEHTWALIMSLVRKVPFAHTDVCQGNWNREAWQGTELRGKTLGVIGCGRVGWQVASIAHKGFGMHVHGVDNIPLGTIKNGPSYQDTLEYVLRHSDIITVHVPLNDETKGMFGAKQFAMMKPTAYFINTSRGAVVDEEALLSAVKAKQIKGAALDVLSDEGMYSGFANHKLRDYAQLYDEYNLIITPHIAGNTAESRESTQLFIANKIKEFIQGGG